MDIKREVNMINFMVINSNNVDKIGKFLEKTIYYN